MDWPVFRNPEILIGAFLVPQRLVPLANGIFIALEQQFCNTLNVPPHKQSNINLLITTILKTSNSLNLTTHTRCPWHCLGISPQPWSWSLALLSFTSSSSLRNSFASVKALRIDFILIFYLVSYPQPGQFQSANSQSRSCSKDLLSLRPRATSSPSLFIIYFAATQDHLRASTSPSVPVSI